MERWIKADKYGCTDWRIFLGDDLLGHVLSEMFQDDAAGHAKPWHHEWLARSVGYHGRPPGWITITAFNELGTASVSADAQRYERRRSAIDQLYLYSTS
jgi:hypothetical protein